ncbi:hypothetical protein [Azospirillum palustre]|nr:hypothetical protein [Azospirillum palustre]
MSSSGLRPQATVTPSPYSTFAVLGFRHPDDTCQAVAWRVIANDADDALAIVQNSDPQATDYTLRSKVDAIGGARLDASRRVSYYGPWPWDRP